MDTADDPQDALLMPSLRDFRDTLEALTQTPYPPRSLFIQASSNVTILEDIIRASLPDATNHSGGSPAGRNTPSIQDLLPQAVIVDCAQVASTKALYGRILNGLSGWGRGEWNDTLGGVLNWDGRLDGYAIQQAQATQKWQIKWDYSNAADSNPSKTSSNNTGKTGIIDRKDESFSAFLEGLKMIFELGEANTEEEEREAQTTTRESFSFRKPRFVVLLNAERLPELESIPVGQNEGTLLASFMRLGELVS